MPDVKALYRSAIALSNSGDLAGAIRDMEAALALDRDNQWIRYVLSQFRLAIGDFARGLEDHEARASITSADADLIAPARLLPWRQVPLPPWKGEDLSGRTILVHAEQGLGDTIQFARYVPMVAQLGARVFFVVSTALKTLFVGLRGPAAIFSFTEVVPVADFQVLLMSLPHRFGTRLETIPADVPYLSVPGTLKASIGRRPGAKMTIGIVWAGRPENGNDRQRSMPVAEFRALADLPEVELCSLQVGARTADLRSAGLAERIADFSPQLTDFAITAAVLQELDLIITVDTAVAHLAGAMGRPCWVLLPFAADWRWLQNREDSPWYPTLRLFRQSSPGDWAGVMQRVRGALQEGGARAGR